MFPQIVNTAFSSDVADEIFTKIVGGSYDEDRSFVGTARALLTPHLPADFDGVVKIEYTSWTPTVEDGTIHVLCFPEPEEHDVIRVVAIPVLNNLVEDGRNKFIEDISAQYPGFQYDEKVTVFFETSVKLMTCYSFVDKENRNTVIFVEDFNRRKNHALQSMIPRFTPWWWDGTSPSPDERELLMSLCSRFSDKVQKSTADGTVTSDGYTLLMKKYEPLYDFRGAKIRKYLPQFAKKCAEGEMERVRTAINNIDSDIARYESSISDLCRQRHDEEIRLLGLRTKAQEDEDTSLADYFVSNPYVDLVSVSGYEMTFCVYTTLDWWDDERAPYLVNNRDSEMYARTGGIRKDDYAKLLKAVFVDRTMMLRVCAAYKLDISAGSMTGIRGYTSFSDTTYVPNAHIQHHGCTGNYRQQFRDAISHGDFVLAIDIAVTSAKSLNFGDISFGEMMRDIGDRKDSKLFQDADGNMYTAAEAIKRIKQLEKEAKK